MRETAKMLLSEQKSDFGSNLNVECPHLAKDFGSELA